MKAGRRSNCLLVIIALSIAIVWMVFSLAIVPQLIERAYQSESLDFFNNLFSGRSKYPVEHYLNHWEKINQNLILFLFLCSLFPLPLLLGGPYGLKTSPELKNETNAKKRLLFNVVFVLLIIFFILIVYFKFPVQYVVFITEDYFAEFGTFVCFGLIFCFLVIEQVKHKSSRSIFNKFFTLIAIFIAMEEISFGQRIFGFESPSFWGRYNIQGELNLHNFLNNKTFKILGSLFLFLCLLLTSLASKLVIFRQYCKKIGLPIIPIYLWPYFGVALYLFIYNPILKSGELAELFLGVSLLLLVWDKVREVHHIQNIMPQKAQAGLLLHVSVLTIGFVVFFNTPTGLKNRLNEFAVDFYPSVGMHRQAELIFEWLNRNPQFSTPETKIHYGELLMQVGRQADGADVLESALREQEVMRNLRPEDPEPVRNSATILSQLARHEEAERMFNEAIRLDEELLGRVESSKDRCQIFISLGRTFLAKGDQSAAHEWFTKARPLILDRKLSSKVDNFLTKFNKSQAQSKP